MNLLLVIASRATTSVGEHLRWLGHENGRLLLVAERCACLLAKVLAIHKVDLGLLRETDARRDIGRKPNISRRSLQAHALPTIDAACECLVELASVLGGTHSVAVFRDRTQAVLKLLRAIWTSVTLGAFADLLFRSILTLVGQIVRVGVLRSNLFDTVAKLGRVDSQH